MQSNNLVDVNSLIDESPHQSQSVDVNSLIEQPQKKNSSQTSSNISAPSTSPSNGQLGLLNGQRPQEYSLNKSGFKPVINMEVPKEPETQAATEKVGLTPIQDLQKQNTSRPDNTIAIPNIGVFNKQVNAFGEVTDKTITDNAPDESVVLRNEYNQKRKGILNPQVVVPQSELTPENNFGLASPSNQAISDATVVSKPIKKIAGAPQNEPAPPTPEQQFKQKVDENLTQLDKETIAKTGEYAMKVTSDPVAAGFITKAVLGDNIAISQKRQIDKGYNVPQADLYNTGQVGISSFMAALDKKYADDPQNADYLKQKADLQNQAATLIDKFPEYKTSQLTKAVAIELGKLHPETANNAAMAKLYLPELKKEMGLSDADIKNIDFDNYPTSNFITSAIAPIYKGALGLGAFGTRIIGDVVGDDKDFLNSKITQMQQSPTFFDDIQTMQNTGVTVDANKTSPTFLQDVADPNKGKYNYNFHTISNAIGNGVGQLAWFVYGSKGIGTAAEKIAGDIAAKSGGVAIDGLPFKLSPDATNEVGMAGLMIGQGYEDNYQKARNIISDKPEDEWKRHAFALLQGSLDYLGFRVLGNVVKGLPPTAEKEIGEVFKDAPNLAAVNKTALQSKLTQILKGAGEAAKETAFVGSATTLSEIAKAAVVNVLGNDKAAEEENKQLPDVIASSLMGLPFNMFLPIVGAKIIAGGQSKIQNENIYNAGISPENYKGDAHKLFEMGAINQEQLNDRIQVINTAANVVKSIPSDVFDNLNHNQRVSYVNSKIKEAALKAKAANIQDDALSEFYNSQIKNEVAKRADILNGGGKEGEYPQSVAVLKPKTKEEINNQIPDVTIAPTENIPEKQPTDAKVILPQTIAKEQGRQIITTSDKNNETQNAEVPKPSKEASTPNEGANKIEQPTEENLVSQAKDLVNSGVVKGFTEKTLKESANNNPEEFKQHLKDISEQANDPKSNRLTVDTYGKELVDIAQKLNPVEGKTEQNTSTPTEAKEPLTKEAQDLLNGLNSGSKPTFITKNLERIANENGIEITGKMSADDVISALKEKQITTTPTEVNKPISVNEGEPLYNPLNENASKLLNQSLEKYSQSNKSTQNKLVEKVKENNREINDRISFLRENGVNEKGANFIDLQDQLSAGKEFLKRVSPKEKPISKPISEEAKPTVSDKFKNKYKDKVKGLFDTGESKDAEKTQIKTDNGKQPIDQYVSRAKEVASKLFPDAKFETFDNHADFEKAGGIEGSRGTAMTDENGNKTILLNLAQMKEDGVGKTAFHEVIHPIVSEVFGRTPEELVPVWNEIATTMRDVEGMDKVWEHLVWYNEHKTPVEGITEFLTQIADGNIKVDDIPKAKQSKLFDLINKLFEKLGIKFKIDSGLDLHNFATEIKKAFDTGNVEGLRRYTDKESEPQKEELRKSVKHLLAKPDSNAASLFGAEKERQAILDAFEYTTRGTIKKTHSVDVKAYDSKNGTRYLAMDKEGDVLSGAFVDKNNKITGIVTDSGYENVGIGTKLYKEVLKLNPDAEPDGTISKQGQRLIDRANADTSSDKEALVRNMVQDAMDEGLTSLNEVSDAITSGLENNSSELKKLIEDAFNKINEPIVTSESGGNDNIPPKERGVDNSGDTFSEWSRVNLESLNKIKDQFRKIGIGWDERAESAMRNLQKRSKKGERLYDTALREMDNFYKSLSKDKTPRFNTDDQVAMHFLKIATEQSMANLAEDAMSKNAFSNVESIGADILSDQFNRVSAVLGAMRSESGVGLAYGNVEARLSPDYGLKVRQMQMIRANKGEPLSDEQNNFVKDHWEKEKELNKREQEVREQALKDEYEKRISDLQSNFEKQIKALKEKKAPEPNTKNQKTKLSSSLRDISKRIRETNEFDKFIKGEKGDTKAAGITFDMKEGLAQAIDYIAKAVEGTEKLSDAIKKAVDKYKGDLDENGVKDFKEKIHTLITKASLPDREYVFSKIKELAHKDNASSITKEMVGKNLIKNFIDSHIGDFDKKDILNEATKRLQEVLPDVTKEQVTEAYLKKGDYVLPKKNRLDEDVSKEKLALKKIAKDELTANQQQKIKLQEEKQKALKRIEELKGMQERGEYVTEEPSKPVVLTKQDAELINIDRERNKLESAYRKEAAKIKENQNHVVQRVADTVRSLWVAVLIGRPKTFAKIAWFMVARPTSEVLSKLSFGKAFGLVAPDLASAAKAGGESNSIRSVGKMTAAFFKNMGEDKLQRLYENGEKRYILAKAAYEQYKNTEGHSDKKLAVLKRDMDNKMFDSLGNVMYQFIGGSSIKDAIETLVHRTNIIEKQFGKIRDENIKEGNTLDKVNYVMGFIGRSHSALKTLSGRASFAGAFMARIEAAYERGQDLGADKLLEIAHESYLDWERGKYQQSNWISDTWNRIVSSIDEGKVNKEKWKNYNKSAQLLARTEVAITRVPVNIIHEEVAEYLAGAFRAPILAAKAYNKAKAQAIEEGYTKKISVNDEIESGTAKEQFKKRVGEIVRDMDGEQAAKVMRLFRKGGMGLGLYAAALIWGGIHFGIFPHKGQKKVKKDEDLAPDELNPGQIMFGNDKLGEVTSAMISHTPALWDTFMGLGLAKSYYDDVNNGRTTTDAAARALTLHLKIIESNIPQAQIISPTETVQKVGAGFKKNVLDSWGLTDAKETKGGLPKNSTAYAYLDKHNIDVAVPEKFEVKVGKDKKHPFGRMTDEDYSKFKKIRSSLLKERLSEFLPNAQEAGLPRDKVQEEIKSISSSVTKIAKNQMISDGIISPINNNE